MDILPQASGHHFAICPLCEASKMVFSDLYSAKCPACGYRPSDAILKTLRQIVTLPDAIGAHAQPCGHPEMCRLPGGVYWCPACGSRVRPVDSGAS